MTKKSDPRPICTCSAYPFPHRIGGRCDGSAFTEAYFIRNREKLCMQCNCNGGFQCEVASGQESIEYAECYTEAKHHAPGEYLQIEIEDLDPYSPS